ncbi:MAG: NblA/ycf18 family protein [Alphaproteobacteria bacterium]
MSETQLTMEQEFQVRAFKESIKGLSREQAIGFLGKMFEQWVVKEALYKSLLQQEWGICKDV